MRWFSPVPPPYPLAMSAGVAPDGAQLAEVYDTYIAPDESDAASVRLSRTPFHLVPRSHWLQSSVM
ncbi:hypothetical protein [Streptomyces sp. HUAS TT20]|uniref:hypothetical protein n=1 Tax=Streptomyces sp. HUAS TT20 TaxID=3447509 RepID=UPI0021D8ABF6|nr:hypothetical protein [Streptomyces sp. HUAS 15-9]UXY25509.1 hypothetical protein N8I87_02305 [Streptomyces sp. HUAS 15-9]